LVWQKNEDEVFVRESDEVAVAISVGPVLEGMFESVIPLAGY